MVHFATELDPRLLPRALSTFTDIVPWSVWERRVRVLRSRAEHNPYWRQFLVDRYGLELALSDVRDYQRTTGRWPWPPRSAQQYRLASFVAVAVRVWPNLSSKARDRFAGAIRSALDNESNLGPVAHEMRIVGHLMLRGFDVTFNDLENGGGFDFLARRGDGVGEVECKHISADIGRQIHRRQMYDMGGRLNAAMAHAVDQGGSGRLLQVRIPGRLDTADAKQQALASRVTAALNGIPDGDPAVCTIAVENFEIATSIFSGGRGHNLTLKDVQEFISKRFNLEGQHILSLWHPGTSAVLVHFSSAKPDAVVASIVNRLKDDAKRQFTGQSPAFLFAHLADLTPDELVELAEADRAGEVTGIQRGVSVLMHKRPHLHSVALLTDGNVMISDPRRARAVQETGPTYVFRNPEHPRADCPVMEQIA
jgi:hypothetical protein